MLVQNKTPAVDKPLKKQFSFHKGKVFLWDHSVDAVSAFSLHTALISAELP